MQTTALRTSNANGVRAPGLSAASNPNAILSRYKPMGASAETASQDRLPPGVGSSHKMARTDLPRLKKYADAFEAAGKKHGLPPALLAAIASRESRGGTILDPNGWGDRGNGFGLMQVDKNSHTPRGGPHSLEHIDQAAGILERMLNQVRQKHPNWSPAQQLRGAVAAYNVGTDNVRTIERMDVGTTGNDYSNDVWARAQALAPHFGGASGTSGSTGSTGTEALAPKDSFEPSSKQWTAAPSLEDVKKDGKLLKEGMRGPAVKKLQEMLGIEADGKFGKDTKAAVAAFQRGKGLEPGAGNEGVVGKTTLEALEKSGPVADAPRGDAIRVTGYREGKPFKLDVVPVGTDIHGNKEYLRPDAAAAWKRMKAAAARDGVTLQLTDAFRSQATQLERRRQYGKSAAPPGYSNHQQGISMDINPTSKAYAWLRENSRRFGIIPGDKTPGDLDNMRNESQHFTYRPEYTVR